MVGEYRLPEGRLQHSSWFTCLIRWIQPPEFIFHKTVERYVDNYVDKSGKSAMIWLFDRIA